MPRIIDDCPQGSPDWFACRLGIPTASEFHRFITPATFKASASEGRETYLYEKIAERVTNSPLPGFGGSFATEQGSLVEPRARAWFELERDCEIRQVSFVETDDGKAGCSPDGLLGDDEGIEIKCPRPQKHVEYLLKGELPKDYRLQVYGSLFVTGRKRWHFLSYCRRFKPLLLTIERDEVIMEKIGAAVDAFAADFEAGLAAIKAK